MFRWMLTVGLAATVLAGAVVAHACSCYSPMMTWVAPADGADDLPINARIWVAHAMSHLDEEDLWICAEVLGPDGELVPGSCSTLETTGGMGITVFRPDADLEPNTEYTVEIWREQWTIETGNWRDVEAPSPPEIVEIEGISEALHFEATDCGADQGVVLHAHFDGVLLALDIADESTVAEDSFGGLVSEVSGSGEIFAGESDSCRGNSWPEAAPLATTTVQLGAFDIAGNFSGFGDPVDVQVPPAGCSCTVGDGPGAASGAALALGALLVVCCRRRRSATTRKEEDR